MSSGSRRRSRPGSQVGKTVRLEDAKPFREEIARSVKSKYRPILVVLSGERTGTQVEVGGNVLVGRDPEAELCLDDVGVSWHHAYLEDRAGSWAVVDEGSTNGTAVNGEAIEDAPLRHGDKLLFGSTLVRFEIQDAADMAYDEFVSRLINIDDLSGLYLRRRFDSELRDLLGTAATRGEALGLLVMDLDGVKTINDTHGHSFGAYVIGEAGRVIGSRIEQPGIACRWGGDEFLAAMPGCNLEATVTLGDSILQAINNHAFEHDGVQLHPGISIGAASFPQQGKDSTSLFEVADGALYRAKHAGKNRVST